MPADADHFPPLDPARLENRTFLVSGATGAVGAAVVERLVASGARLAVAVRRATQLEGLRTALAAAEGRACLAHVGTSDAEAAQTFVATAEDALGPVDAFVSCAGAFAFEPIHEVPAGRDRELLEANFCSAHTLVRAVVSPMIRRKSGALVFTGARILGTPVPGMALYAASKAALHEYAHTLAAELAPAGVRVGVVAPGIIDTPANRAAMPDADRSDWHPIDSVADALLATATRGSPADEVVRRL